MRNKSGFFLSAVLIASTFAAFCSSAHAEFPEKPITLIAPFPAGGSVDIVARVIAIRLGKALGQSITVDNRAGAATIIGTEALKKAAPDGYTLMLGTSTTFVINPLVYDKLSYDPSADFDPIGVVGSTSMALLANKDVPAANVKALMSDIKAKPEIYSYGSHGNGSTVHFAAEMLWGAAGVKGVVHIPYKGSAPAITDLSGGQIPISFDAVPAAAAAAKGGRVKILAVTGSQRSALLPNVPTVAESGYPGFNITSWFAVIAPKGLPIAIKTRLEKELQIAMDDPETKQRLAAQGFDVAYGPSSQYYDFLKTDTAKLAPIAKSNNIKAN